MRHRKMPSPFIGGNAKQRRKERRSGTTRATWVWYNHGGTLR